MTPPTAHTADPWNRYGRSSESDARARGTGGRLYWDWYQRIGPGAEILGDVTGWTVADIGAGVGRQAAHVADMLGARRVLAIDTSSAQIARGRELFGHVPALEFFQADAAAMLRAAPGSLDAVYSCYGAADFADPRELLPAIAAALRPGGGLVLSTLAHYRGGRPAEGGVRPGMIPVRGDDGTEVAMERWVLGGPVWEKLLTDSGFTDVTTDVLRDPGTASQPPMATTLIRATRQATSPRCMAAGAW